MTHNLESNIRKYCLFRIFTKRTFLPLISIYMIDHGAVTLGQLAWIWSITSLVSLVMEIPAGYIADRIGHKRALILGAAISAISVLPYIFMVNFYGALAAGILFFGGFSFLSGTMQAFMHETLLALGRDHEYTRIMGMAQSYGLLGNIVLVTLVPLTYQIDPTLPFVLGFLCLAVNCVIAWRFISPPRRIPVVQETDMRTLAARLRELSQRTNIALLAVIFIMFGIASASYQNAGLFREVIFKESGIPVAAFGLILAVGSLLAAIVGRYIHLLEKLRPGAFYLLDALYLCFAYTLVGVSGDPAMVIIAFSLFAAYDRTRSIIFEAQILREFPSARYKSTILSVLNFSTIANALWAPLILSALAEATTLRTGYALYGIAAATILGLLIASYWLMSRRKVS